MTKQSEKHERGFWHEELKEPLNAMGHVTRIETYGLANGQPDVNYAIEGVDGNIELKAGNRKRALKLRPSQRSWFRQRTKAHGVAWVLWRFRCDNGGVVYGIVPGHAVNSLDNTTNYSVWAALSAITWTDEINMEELKCILTLRPIG